MNEDYKIYLHTPPHLYRSNAKYFITGATYNHYPYLKSVIVKQKTIEYMFKSFSHFSWKIEDWVLLDNHYHIMAEAPENAKTLSKVINNFHKFSAIWIKKHIANYNVPVTVDLAQSNYPKIWYNYWDTCITYEQSYYARINYIWYNPVKHGYVSDPNQWAFGSFVNRQKNTDKAIKEITEKYPCDRINVKDDF